MLKNIKYKTLANIFFLVIVITIINLFTLWNLKWLAPIPFSVPTVTMFSLFIKFGGTTFVYLYIVTVLLIHLISFIDIFKFKNHIVFPYISVGLYIFDFLYLIALVVTASFDLFYIMISIILCIISDLIILIIMLVCISKKRNYLNINKKVHIN